MKTMVTIFFTSTRLLVLNFLPKSTEFNQDFFIDSQTKQLGGFLMHFASAEQMLWLATFRFVASALLTRLVFDAPDQERERN
jgi:hypothetical protein